MAGRKKQIIKRSIHSIKATQTETALIKRFMAVVRDGCGADVVLKVIESIELKKVQRPEDGERLRTTILAYNHEWIDIQLFASVLLRCSVEDKARLIKALEDGEQLRCSDQQWAVVVSDCDGVRLMVVDGLENANKEFVKQADRLGCTDIEKYIPIRRYTADGSWVQIQQVSANTYISISC